MHLLFVKYIIRLPTRKMVAQKQKKEEGEAYVTTILFDNVCERIHDRVELGKVPPMTEKEYSVRGCTVQILPYGPAPIG